MICSIPPCDSAPNLAAPLIQSYGELLSFCQYGRSCAIPPFAPPPSPNPRILSLERRALWLPLPCPQASLSVTAALLVHVECLMCHVSKTGGLGRNDSFWVASCGIPIVSGLSPAHLVVSWLGGVGWIRLA